jgi:cellulose biosynthesis protein BcsQ
MAIYVFDNDKGGVTKTTTAFHFANYLAIFVPKPDGTGRTVLVVPMDSNPGMRTMAFKRTNPQFKRIPRRTIYDIMLDYRTGLDHAFLEYELSDERGIFAAATAKISAEFGLKLPTTPGRLFFVEDSRQIARASTKYQGSTFLETKLPFERSLDEFLRSSAVAGKFDDVVIDNGPNDGPETYAGMVAADFVITPVDPSPLSFEGLKEYKERLDLSNTIATSTRIGHPTKHIGVVLTRVIESYSLHAKYVRELPRIAVEDLKTTNFATMIPESEAIAYSALTKIPAYVADPPVNRPASPGEERDMGPYAMIQFSMEVMSHAH